MNQPLVQCQKFDADALANILLAGPAAGCLNGAFLRTFSAAPAVNPETTLATAGLVASAFTGHADKAITWSTVGTADAGGLESLGITTLIAATDSVTPEFIVAMGILDTTKAFLYHVAVLATPIPMTALGDQALVTVRMNIDGTASLEIIS